MTVLERSTPVYIGMRNSCKESKNEATWWTPSKLLSQEVGLLLTADAGSAERQLSGKSSSLVWTSVERFYSCPVLIAELNQLTRKFHAEVESGRLAIDVELRSDVKIKTENETILLSLCRGLSVQGCQGASLCSEKNGVYKNIASSESIVPMYLNKTALWLSYSGTPCQKENHTAMVRLTCGSSPKQKKDIVYQIPCLNCNSVYIGETSRDLSIRIKEHQRNISKLNPNSLIVDHVRETGHTPDFNNTRILHTNAKTKTQRLILEAIETMKHPKPLNKSIQLPSQYVPLLA
ncbi:hypothetical protein LAZ67_17002464 [Cordylochernes scorpioides]|uniref:GIY-YIG domain-containing protein n=1 Tax=Cordylochernes scorpioides TaxID=51811 RepID=A0ABY6LGM3_9ARAC|nr:hypothetical protein LAZ67_17002464 [Cordylochernes scorpioides]